MKDEEVDMITVYTIEDWREWLKKNHLDARNVGVICHKKHTGKPFITHREAMEEAICFGWIDTTAKRLDEDRFIRYFVRRGKNANWSINTLSYAKALSAAGRMSHQGLMRYEEGMKKKPHDFGLPKKPRMPSILKKELKNKGVLKEFMKFSPSAKYTWYRWILRAKREETKSKRVNEIVNAALNRVKIQRI